VRELRKSSLAIVALVIPEATSPSTSTSLEVSPAGSSGAEAGDGCVVAEEGYVAEGLSALRAYSMACSGDKLWPSDHAASKSGSASPPCTVAR
jgi:hypothetical protein